MMNMTGQLIQTSETLSKNPLVINSWILVGVSITAFLSLVGFLMMYFGSLPNSSGGRLATTASLFSRVSDSALPEQVLSGHRNDNSLEMTPPLRQM